MNAPQEDSFAGLAQELQLCWSLLELAVRLERHWHARLHTSRDEALRSALDLGRRVLGEDAEFSTLAELRVLVVGKVSATVDRADVALESASLDHAAVTAAREVLSETRDIGLLLQRGVNLRDCSCTNHRDARRALVGRLLGPAVPEPHVDSAHEIARLACGEATRRLSMCIDICLAACRRCSLH